jgi:hypothetical protein
MTVPLVGTGSGRDIQETLARVLSANGIRAIARGYDHSLLPNGVDIAVEYDSSVQGESRWAGVQWYPVEIKTRILNGIDDWEAVVPNMLEICRYMGARVNTSTGHHIHLSFDEVKENPRTVRSLWNVFHRFDDVIFGLVAPSRRNNSYCRPMPSNAAGYLHGVNSLRTLRNKLGVYDRYYALNLTHLWNESPHLELRHHQGTLNPTTARMWLRFCLQLVQHSCNRNCQTADAPTPNDRRGIEALLTVCGFKVNTKVYCKVAPELRECGKHMLQRWKHFNGSTSLRQIKAEKQSQTPEVD